MDHFPVLQQQFDGRLLITVAEAAHVIGVGAKTVRNQLTLGQFPINSVKVGGRRFFRLADVAAFLDGSPAQPAAPQPVSEPCQVRRGPGRPPKAEQLTRQKERQQHQQGVRHG